MVRFRAPLQRSECISFSSDNSEAGAIWKVTGLVEASRSEDAPSHLFIVGRYLLSPKIMELPGNSGSWRRQRDSADRCNGRLLARKEMYALVIDAEEGCDAVLLQLGQQLMLVWRSLIRALQQHLKRRSAAMPTALDKGSVLAAMAGKPL